MIKYVVAFQILLLPAEVLKRSMDFKEGKL